MGVISQSSHALFFNGVTDSVVCPQGDFTKTGLKTEIYGGVARSSASVLQDGDGHRFANINNQTLTSFTVEAWVSPDCGGVIASKAGLFDLRMGTINAPGVASFKVELSNGVTAVASSANNYPTAAGSFIANNVGYNVGQRELYHISGEFNGQQVKLYVNGELMASHKLNKNTHATLMTKTYTSEDKVESIAVTSNLCIGKPMYQRLKRAQNHLCSPTAQLDFGGLKNL